MEGNARYSITAGIIVVVLLGGFFWFWNAPKNIPAPALNSVAGKNTNTTPSLPPVFTTQSTTQSTPQQRFVSKPGVETRYVNTVHHFSFAVPDGFLSADTLMKIQNGQEVVVYDTNNNNMGIIILPVTSSVSSITTDDIASISPNLQITNVQKVSVLPGVSGLAFESNNPAWKGSAVEFWFVYKGFLYEISAPSADADLVNFIWGSWEWQ